MKNDKISKDDLITMLYQFSERINKDHPKISPIIFTLANMILLGLEDVILLEFGNVEKEIRPLLNRVMRLMDLTRGEKNDETTSNSDC